MRVFKFGGASVKDAEGVTNVANIIKSQGNGPLAVVISAMGKTTNALEAVANAFYYKNADAKAALAVVESYHQGIVEALFADKTHPVYTDIAELIGALDWALEEEPIKDYDFEYDQIVHYGELLSTKIVAHYLNSQGIACLWVDARDCIVTDNTYRDAQVDWPATERLVNDTIGKALAENPNRVVLTQGFIGITTENYTTTLGREGSDFTAAILAYSLNAESVTIWKDVPGVLNADPKLFAQAQKFDNLSYHDSIELTYYGATVIHPKTIKPLENKKICLWVKSFYYPTEAGTEISENSIAPRLPQCIVKDNQTLLSIMPKDFSFFDAENLHHIFKIFSTFNIKINLMQNSAVSFTVCINYTSQFNALVDTLNAHYKTKYNGGLQLFTIRHYNYGKGFDEVIEGKTILLEQRSRTTAQYVVQQTV